MTDLREFAEASFDAVLAVEEPLSFASDPAMAVAEMALVTRPGGTVAASVANRFCVREFEKFLRRGDVDGLARFVDGGAAGERRGPVARRVFSGEEVERLFAANGLDVVSAVGKGIFAGAAGRWLADDAVFSRVLSMETAHNANRSFCGSRRCPRVCRKEGLTWSCGRSGPRTSPR